MFVMKNLNKGNVSVKEVALSVKNEGAYVMIVHKTKKRVCFDPPSLSPSQLGLLPLTLYKFSEVIWRGFMDPIMEIW